MSKYLSFNDVGLKPAKSKKGRSFYKLSDVNKAAARMIVCNSFFYKKAIYMTEDLKKASALLDTAVDNIDLSMHRFITLQDTFIAKGKKASGDIRDASEKLAQGVARIEKTANFERLERYVELLERASVAMNALAELEKSGKLEKIAASLK
jgi:hypothetical protein